MISAPWLVAAATLLTAATRAREPLFPIPVRDKHGFIHRGGGYIGSYGELV
jgi:hypothetical protein